MRPETTNKNPIMHMGAITPPLAKVKMPRPNEINYKYIIKNR